MNLNFKEVVSIVRIVFLMYILLGLIGPTIGGLSQVFAMTVFKFLGLI